MNERGGEIGTEESLHREYSGLIGYAIGIISELQNYRSALPEKLVRRIEEFNTRRENISEVWMNNVKKSTLSKEEMIKKYNEIIPMLKELVGDVKKFEDKKLYP